MATLESLKKRIEEEERRRKEVNIELQGEIDQLDAAVAALEGKVSGLSLSVSGLLSRVTDLEEPAPEEPPVPAPTPDPTWKTVFEDDFENGLTDGLKGFVLGTDNDTKPTTSIDGKCAFTLNPGQGRSELSINSGTDAQKWTEGETLLIKETFYVPTGFPYGGPGSHCTIQQFRQNTSAGSPLLSLELGDYGEGKGLYLHDKSKGDEYLFVTAVSPALPLRTELEIVTSRTGKGFYALGVDGTPSWSRTDISTIPPEASYAYIKTGLYRTPIQGTSQLKISDISVSVPA